jgi:hypothetical protein
MKKEKRKIKRRTKQRKGIHKKKRFPSLSPLRQRGTDLKNQDVKVFKKVS